MKTHAIMLRLTTPAPEREVEHFAAAPAGDEEQLRSLTELLLDGSEAAPRGAI